MTRIIPSLRQSAPQQPRISLTLHPGYVSLMAAAPKVLLYDYPGSICCQMVRLTLAEKGVAYAKQTVDIMGKAEQFELWYTALNSKAVVPTLKIGARMSFSEIVMAAPI